MSSEAVFKAMADATRQRILQVLLRHELSVSELVAVLGQPQSTVSRHLRILRDVELISDRRDGVTVHYAMAPKAVGGDNDTAQSHVVRWLEGEAVPKPVARRVDQVLERRHAETVSFFHDVGRRWDEMRTNFFGSSFHLEALTALLPKTWVAADIGTGSGYLLPALAGTFEKVIAVEPVERLLEAARERPELRAADNIDYRSGDLRQLPMADGEVDLAVAMLVLHHVPDPAAALREIGRVVKPGGRVLVVEQRAHRCEAFRELMQGRWWGFETERLEELVRDAGFAEPVSRRLETAWPTSPSAPEVPELFGLTAVRQAG